MAKVKRPTKARKGKAKGKEQTVDREVVHPELSVSLAVGGQVITAEEARGLLGWTEEGKGEKWGNDYYCQTLSGTRVRCSNAGLRQRPFMPGLAKQWMHEILGRPGAPVNPETGLGGNWQVTGESIVVGRTGLIIEGQHRLVALVWAAEMWAEDPGRFPGWKGEPVLSAVVVYGVSESVAVVNVMNTGKPRSLGDAIYSCGLFKGDKKDVVRLSRMLDHAVRLLWHRTGASLNAFAPRRTHADSLNFIERHPKLLEAVKHIYEEDSGEKKIAVYVGPGYAAALLYLMGCSGSELEKYRAEEPPTEAPLDWTRWDGACDFWVLMAAGSDHSIPVRRYLGELAEAGRLSNPARWGVMVKAWSTWLADQRIGAEDLELSYLPNDDGIPVLDETPTVGGIDLGSPAEAVELAGTPGPEELDRRKTEVRKNGVPRAERKAKRRPKRLSPSRATDEWAKGDVAWVRPGPHNQDEEPYLATLVEDPYECDDKVMRLDVKDAEGETWTVDLDQLSLFPGTGDGAEKVPSPSTPTRPTKAKKGKSRSAAWHVGQTVWIVRGQEEPWQGRIKDLLQGGMVRVTTAQGFRGAGIDRLVPVGCLRTEQPIAPASVPSR